MTSGAASERGTALPSAPGDGTSTPQPVLLRMGELSRRAGVPTSVITFYLAQGLLPRPLKTSRNMAWYTEDTVDWVRLIRELQEQAFLPLRVVKKVIASGSTPEQIREYFAARGAGPVARDLEPVSETALVAEGFPASALRRLERLGVLVPRDQAGERSYGADDAALVRELGRMRAAGLSPQRGFGVEQLRIYVDAMEALAQKEIELAIGGLVGSMRPEALAGAAQSWLAGANAILCLLHKKALKRRVRELAGRMARPEAAPAASQPPRPPRPPRGARSAPATRRGGKNDVRLVR